VIKIIITHCLNHRLNTAIATWLTALYYPGLSIQLMYTFSLSNIALY